MKYPFWLKKMLAESGLGKWIPGASNLFVSPNDILGACSDTILHGDFESLVNPSLTPAPPSPDFLDLSSDFIQGLGMPVHVLPRTLAVKDFSPPGGLSETREAVSNYLEHEYGAFFDPTSELLITNGINHGIKTVLDSFVNPGENVLLPDPCPPDHELLVRNHGANPIWITLRQEDGKLLLSELELKKRLRSSRVAIFSCPSNPTGGVFEQETFKKIGSYALKNNCILLWDNSLLGLQLDGTPIHPGNLDEIRKVSLSTGSLSISHGISAANVGWLTGNENLIAPCKLLSRMRNENISLIGQQILIDSFNKPESKEWQMFINRLKESRNHHFQKLSNLGLDPYWPAGGLFIWIPVWRKEISSTDFCKQLEQKYKLLIKPGIYNGPSGEGYARVSFGVDEGRSNEALRRLELYLENKPLVVNNEISKLAA